MLSAEILPRVLSVKGQWALTVKYSDIVIPYHLKIWMSPLDYPIMCLEKALQMSITLIGPDQTIV